MRALLAALLLFVAGPARAGTLRVVATVPDLAAIASEVVGDDGTVTAMALATQDPHFVDARPNLALELARADALVAVGLELEIGWLPTLQTGSRNAAIQSGGAGYIDCSQFVSLLQVPAGQVDRSMGDIHPGGNPHYLYDPRNAGPIARGIADRLGRLDPDHRDAFAARAEAFASRVDEATAGWEAELAPLRGAPVVAYHRSLPYLEDWLGFQVVIEVEPKPGVPPTPQHVAQVLVTAREHGAKVVLQESYYPTTTTKLVADKAGASLVVLPSGADFQSGQAYLDHVQAVVDLLKGAA